MLLIHYHLPLKEDEFTHRNGRTARMLESGTAYIVVHESEKKLDYINSTGINFFIKALTKARVKNGDLILSGAQGSVLTIVQVSKMNEVFTMTETIEEALTIHNTKK